MSTLFRQQLFDAAAEAAFPDEPVLDLQTGLVQPDAQSAVALARLFELFGITQLAPLDADFDKVINTACTLSAEVCAHVQALDEAGGEPGQIGSAADWHPDYRRYVVALWQGDRAGIARAVADLGLEAGIPNGSLPLQDGPLA